jgi:hypothetical protein
MMPVYALWSLSARDQKLTKEIKVLAEMQSTVGNSGDRRGLSEPRTQII